MPSVITEAALEEPISLSEVKKHLRVDGSDDDLLIYGLIVATRQRAESICRRALVTQSWKIVLDRFPAPGVNVGFANWYGPQGGIAPGPISVQSTSGKTGYELYLPFPPLQTIEKISYIDPEGQTIELDEDLYIIDAISEPARVTPAYGESWPATRSVMNAVSVEFTCGYGDVVDVPAAIKQWMLLNIGALYENRESTVTMQSGVLLNFTFVDGLLDPYRCIVF